MSNKYNQKLFDSAIHATKVAKKSMTHAIKTVSKRAIQKIAEATGHLIGNKISDKVTSVSKKPSQNNLDKLKVKYKYQKKDIYLQKKNNELLMNLD